MDFRHARQVRAFARTGRYHNIEVEDDVTAYFEYRDGAHGVSSPRPAKRRAQTGWKWLPKTDGW